MSSNQDDSNAELLKGLQGGNSQGTTQSSSTQRSYIPQVNMPPAPWENPGSSSPIPATTIAPQLMGAYFQPRNGKGTASLVLGIIGLIPFPITGFWCSVLAIIFGVQGRRRARAGLANNHVMATWGMWLGIIGMGTQTLVTLAVAFS